MAVEPRHLSGPSTHPRTPGAARLEPRPPWRGSFYSWRPLGAFAIGACALGLALSLVEQREPESAVAGTEPGAPPQPAAAPAAGAPAARLLFGSGFEGPVEIVPPRECWATGCWQDIVGTDSVTQFAWPAKLWGRGGKFLLLTDPVSITPATVGDYVVNRIETVSGHRGEETRALYQEVSRNANGTAPMGTSPEQNALQLLPLADTGDLYLSYWIKLQPDLVEKMNNLPAGPGVNNGGTWRAFFALKTGGQSSWGGPADDGDYRLEVYVMTLGGGEPYWAVVADNNAGGGAPRTNDWAVENRSVPVPAGEWFKFEIFWHRSAGPDGRVWIAVGDQAIADRRGPNVGARGMLVNRIMAPLLYGGGTMPIYQWVDDLEVWNGVPDAARARLDAAARGP